VPVYVHAALAAQPEIVVQPGRHDATFRLRYADFARLVQPTVIEAGADA
jgi:prolyl-tRNA editing enzyme YbaK/EbsC (Cys-tRNA(Pro) deacylase)